MGKKLNDQLKQKDKLTNAAKTNENIDDFLSNTVSKCTSEGVFCKCSSSGVGGYGLNLI